MNARPGNVFVIHGPGSRHGHEALTLEALARRLAALKGYAYAGEHHAGQHHDGPSYFVPADTLLHADALHLGIHGHDDLFGGVVPHAFAATKVIGHPLVDAASTFPKDWPHTLASKLGHAVLRGFTVFSRADARRAFESLRQLGDVRLKDARGVGGQGQSVVATATALEERLASMEVESLHEHGLVLEQNLTDVVTYSVGRIHFGALQVTYYGTQRLTRRADGQAAYGGSDLVLLRGGYAHMLARQLPDDIRQALMLAQRYEFAAVEAFPSFLASRHNYDVACGLDGYGDRTCGVLEQSWRIGGASAAEIAALEVFATHPERRLVRASTHEIHSTAPCPPTAQVHFSGVVPGMGPLCKYAMVHDDEHPD